MALQCASPRTGGQSATKREPTPFSWPSPQRTILRFALTHTHSMSNFPMPAIVILWYSSLAVAVGANTWLSLPVRDPEGIDQRPIAIQPWHHRARASAMEPFQPTASHTSWPSNGAGLHMQALKPPAATEWGLRAILSLSLCLSVCLSV